MGRIKGVARPAIATPIPVPGSTPTILLDAGANAECQPAWLVQFAQMGAVFARERFGIAEPRVGLLSIGEESTKGNPLVKETHGLLADPGALDRAGARFVGNVEGRDIMTDEVDVVVTDGFTGNVALKTLEGGMRTLVTAVLDALGRHRGGRPGARRRCCRCTRTLDPDNTGGAMLLGVDGVCIISHGSSSADRDRERHAGRRRDGRRPMSSATSGPRLTASVDHRSAFTSAQVVASLHCRAVLVTTSDQE